MPPKAIELQQQLIRSTTAERKLEVSQALRDSAWALKAAWIRSGAPCLADAEVQEAVRRLFADAGA